MRAFEVTIIKMRGGMAVLLTGWVDDEVGEVRGAAIAPEVATVAANAAVRARNVRRSVFMEALL
jgi:hypothetical protein